MPGDLARSIAATDPRLLVPSGSSAPNRLSLVDALQLPGGGPDLLLALAEDDEAQWHVLPLVDDRAGLRRARSGDGWATGVAELVGIGGSITGGFSPRRRGFDLPDIRRLVSESVLESTTSHEVVAVSEQARVRIYLRPECTDAPRDDVLEHVATAGFVGLASEAGDIVWADPTRSVAPLVGVAGMLPGERLDEAFARAADTHLRGGTDAEPTFLLVDAVASTLAGLHLALATPTATLAAPLGSVSEAEAADLVRTARDAVAEALLVASPETQETLRSRRGSMRRSLAPLSESEGSMAVPAAPFRSLTQATVTSDGSVVLDPLELVDHQLSRLPVADVAALLRNLDHVAFGALRRLVGMGESVPVERAVSWAQAVREALLDRYRQLLDGAGQLELFDHRLLLAFEIQAECAALTFAARNLSTWSTVPEVGLLDLLPPD